MTVEFMPSVPRGAVSAPPSKSIAHRALICGALSDRGAVIENIAPSQDVLATLDCLRALGAKTEYNNGRALVRGLDPFGIPQGAVLDCRESGSTLRFLIPLCLLAGRETVFTGGKRLLSRPLGVYKDICESRGIVFDLNEDRLLVKGKLESGGYEVDGGVSSQFISGLMMALPLLGGESVISVTGRFESRPYVDMTADVMSEFGVQTAFDREKSELTVRAAGYKSPENGRFTVEGDYSGAAYLDCFNLLGGSVEVKGLAPENATRQGDSVYKKLFKAVASGEKRFDLADCPDLAPVMFALAARFGGAVFSGTSRLAFKESDRVSSMAAELAKFGARVSVSGDETEVVSGSLHAPCEPLWGHGDHRVVMALSALCCVYSGTIKGAEAVNKSFNGYFEDLRSLGADISVRY